MYHLRVLAGTSLDSLVPITVNSNKSHKVTSDLFEGEIIANIKDFVGHDGQVPKSEYFSREDRQSITWSIQVQGRFLETYSADNILFGNVFERPLSLPWGAGAAMQFMKYIDPTLEHNLTSKSKPWALSPLISTMPHFAHTRLSNTRSLSPKSHPQTRRYSHSSPPAFPSHISLSDDTSQLSLALSLSDTDSSSSTSSGSSSASSTKSRKYLKRQKNSLRLEDVDTMSKRKAFFSDVEHRRNILFGPADVITTDFCYGFLEFNPALCLRLPGGVSFDLAKYWDGQPIRFVCCERKHPNDESDSPWGRIFWCVVVEACDDNVD